MAAKRIKKQTKVQKPPVQHQDEDESTDSEEKSMSESSDEEQHKGGVMNIDEVEQEANDDSSSDDDEEEEDSSTSSSNDTDDEDNNVDLKRKDIVNETMDDKDESTSENKEISKVNINNTTMEEEDEEHCTFDLRNLLAMNIHQMDTKFLYKSPSQDDKDTITNNNSNKKEVCIPLNESFIAANDAYLLKKASEGCQKLIKELWVLPSERTDVGPLVSLPKEFQNILPRQLPPPVPKTETKWQKFAKERGIGTKAKRSRKVYDEATDSWKFLTGYEKATKPKASLNDKEWPIMEVKRGDDPFLDPWEKARDAKRSKLDKNTENRMRNQERSGFMAKGTTTRFMKDKRAAVERGKEGHMKGNAIPSGIPVDLRPSRFGPAVVNPVKRGEVLTKKALVATQRSTASLGKFDQMRDGEPEKKHPLRKRQFHAVTDKKVLESESERGMKVLERIVNGGKQKDRDIRKGKYATGETAYDFDYNDGLGPSSFKKKKGRAGAGKMKKMTKKRAT